MLTHRLRLVPALASSARCTALCCPGLGCPTRPTRPLSPPHRRLSSAAYTDPYAELGVGRGASQSDVDAAYRKLAMQWHPDRNPGNEAEAEERMKRISAAHQAISSGGAGAGGFAGGGGGPGGGFPGGGFPGGFPGGGGGGGGPVDPQMEALLREMLRGLGQQVSEEQLRQMMAQQRQAGRQPGGPGFQSFHWEFRSGGNSQHRGTRQPTKEEQEAMDAHMKQVNDELKAAMKTAAKQAAGAVGRAVAAAAANAVKRGANSAWTTLTSPFAGKK